MSYLEALRERRKTPVAAWHKLRTSITTGKFDFYVAFEGEEDEEFYSKFLTDRFPTKTFRPVICDGKGGVLALHSEVVAAYGGPKNVFFFLDSDHDKFLKEAEYPTQTFSTCGYSVENYIYDNTVILEGIKKHFQLNPSDELVDDIRDALQTDQLTFEARTRFVMSYVVALRAEDQSPNLENIGLHDIFFLSDDGLSRKKLICASLLEKAGVPAVPASAVFQYGRQQQSLDPNEFFRGKIVAQFVLNFCKRLAKRFADKPKLNGKPLKPKIEFSKRNLVSIFVDFVETPQRLSDFLDEMGAVMANG